MQSLSRAFSVPVYPGPDRVVASKLRFAAVRCQIDRDQPFGRKVGFSGERLRILVFAAAWQALPLHGFRGAHPRQLADLQHPPVAVGRGLHSGSTRDVANGNSVALRNHTRPNLVGHPRVSNPTVNQYFSTSAFAVPNFSYGNFGNNVLRRDRVVQHGAVVVQGFPQHGNQAGQSPFRGLQCVQSHLTGRRPEP